MHSATSNSTLIHPIPARRFRRAAVVLAITILLLLGRDQPDAILAGPAPDRRYAPTDIPAGLSAAGWAQITGQLQPGDIAQQAYLKASNTEMNDWFGWSVALSGDTLAVAAYGESSAAGVDGDQSNNLMFQSGAVYIFTRTGGLWSQQAYLKASNTGLGDNFGGVVAISGDTVVVGAIEEASSATGVNGNETDNSAPQAGAAYVFTRTGSDWSQQAYLKASNTELGDHFGYSLALSEDTLAVGAVWEASSATGVNGNQADNSAPSAGAVYVFSPTPPIYLPLIFKGYSSN